MAKLVGGRMAPPLFANANLTQLVYIMTRYRSNLLLIARRNLEFFCVYILNDRNVDRELALLIDKIV
jgi:hypothetical protein